MHPYLHLSSIPINALISPSIATNVHLQISIIYGLISPSIIHLSLSMSSYLYLPIIYGLVSPSAYQWFPPNAVDSSSLQSVIITGQLIGPGDRHDGVSLPPCRLFEVSLSRGGCRGVCVHQRPQRREAPQGPVSRTNGRRHLWSTGMLFIIRVVTLFFGHCIVICREMIDMFGIMVETCLKVPQRFSCLLGQNSICLGYPPLSIWQSLAKKNNPMMHSDFLALYWLDPHGRSAGQRCLRLEKF